MEDVKACGRKQGKFNGYDRSIRFIRSIRIKRIRYNSNRITVAMWSNPEAFAVFALKRKD